MKMFLGYHSKWIIEGDHYLLAKVTGKKANIKAGKPN